MSKKERRDSLPRNFPHHTEDDLKECPSRVINIGRAQDYLFPNNFVKTSKYEVYNFLPKFLLEEFNPKSKIANCYFLILAILQTIPQITNTDGYPTVLLPLSFVVIVDAIFAALEDYSRHRADKEANNASTERYELHEKALGSLKWADLAVGDFVKIYSREKVPADVVVLAVAEKTQPAQGLCYVETKSLDGETNLKTRMALPGTMAKAADIADIQFLKGTLEMEHPNKFINSFSGVITLEGMDPEPIGPHNVLLRGCVLRNTDWIIGCVVNTGHHTKILMSASVTPNKVSGLEAVATSQVKKMILFLCFISAIGAFGSLGWNIDNEVNDVWYLDWGNINFGEYFVIQFFYFFLIHATFIPVSLYVSMTLARFFQSYFMNSDLSMYFEPLDAPAMVRTMTLNEELGQISHIFSDKTGTLTRNVMDFRKASVYGSSYGLGITEIGKASWKLQGKELPQEILLAQEEAQKRSVPHVTFYDPKYEAVMNDKSNSSKNATEREHIMRFFRSLALCHDTIPERIDGKIRLSASNPDDEALVCAATYFGFEFKDKQEKYAVIGNKFTGEEERVEMLETIGFTSKRKRMSVIVRDIDGKIKMVIKGADSAMLPRLASGQDEVFQLTDDHMRQYAVEGMRCLVVGQKEIPEQEYNEWHTRYMAALTNLAEVEKRKAGDDNQIDTLEDFMEQGIDIVGATAIEDRLQAGVPECVAELAKAGINIWVLTGDKEETAINIAVASNLVLPKEHMKHIIVNKTICPSLADVKVLLTSEYDLCAKEKSVSGSAMMPRALIIDGTALIDIMAEAGEAKAKLLQLSTMCRAVVGCRVSPDQKREMVTLIKEGVPGVRTLAIGDGANDVAMIQAADVGVGIRGEEGVQAVNASDYAIAQFEYLKVLLLKHGRYNYSRMCRLIIYMFYKNILMSIVTFWWSWLNGYSGQKVYTEASIQFFNLMFTSLPILLLGIYDMDLNQEVVYKNPQLYQAGIHNELFNTKVFWFSNVNAVFDSVICTYFPVYQLQNFGENGFSETFFQAGALTYTAVVFVANIRVALMQDQWHLLNALILALSIVAWFLVALAVSNILAVDYNWYRLFDRLLGEDSFWASLFCVIVTIFIKDVFLLHIKNTFWPSNVQIMTEIQCLGDPNELTKEGGTVAVTEKEVSTEMIDVGKPGSSMRMTFGSSQKL